MYIVMYDIFNLVCTIQRSKERFIGKYKSF